MNQFVSEVGVRLSELRRKRRKSQYVLAAIVTALNVPLTRDVLANWETGRTDIPSSYVPVLAYALDASITDILSELKPRDINTLLRGRMGQKGTLRTSYARTATNRRRLLTREKDISRDDSIAIADRRRTK